MARREARYKDLDLDIVFADAGTARRLKAKRLVRVLADWSPTFPGHHVY